jgi:hypothetical protein
MALLDEIRANYPWIELMGLADYVIDLIRDGATIDEALAKVRATPQHKARFPGLIDKNGQRRFATEAQYLQEEQSLRQVLIDFDMYDSAQDSPLDYLAFFDQGINAEQLKQRAAAYRSLERGSAEIRDAMYVYAGLNVEVDDLYQAMVSPEFRQQMISAYDEAAAKTNLDYETFITRATERGLKRVAETLNSMQTLGLLAGSAVSQMLSVDPNFAREMMGAIFQGGAAETATLSIDELLASFDYAMIGSAASKSGFALPDKARVEEFRAAGVDRARSLRGYSEAALREGGLGSIADRFNRKRLDQERLEDAFILGEAPAASDVTRLFELERSLGKQGPGFNRALQGTRVTQQGRSLY